MKTAVQRRFALAGGMLGAAYLALNDLLPAFPDFLLGLLLGLGMVFLLLGLLGMGLLLALAPWRIRINR